MTTMKLFEQELQQIRLKRSVAEVQEAAISTVRKLFAPGQEPRVVKFDDCPDVGGGHAFKVVLIAGDTLITIENAR